MNEFFWGWGGGMGELGPNLGFLPFFQVASLVFLDIPQDCSLGQCLTSSRADPPPPKKKKIIIIMTQIGAGNNGKKNFWKRLFI